MFYSNCEKYNERNIRETLSGKLAENKKFP